MFRIVTGKPGAGKSYLGVEMVKKALDEGATIHTNLPLKWDKLEALYPGRLVKLPGNPAKWIQPRALLPGEDEDEAPRFQSDLLIAGSEDAPNLIVIDEASFNFGSTGQAKTGSQKARLQPVYDLLTLQRHFGLDILFITQGKKKLDPYLRDEAAEFTHCKKAANLPFIGWLVTMPLLKSMFFGDFLRTYAAEGGARVGREWVKFRQEIGDLYYTHSFRNDSAMRVNPTRQGNSGGTGTKGAAKTIITLLVCLAAVGWAIWSTIGQLTGGKKIDNLESPAAATAANPDSISLPAAPSSSTAQPATIPKTHRQPLQEVTWAGEDEWVIASAVNSRTGVAIRCRGGLLLALGQNYMGEQITSVTFWRGWYYWTTETGRVVVSRPSHPIERVQWWAEYRDTLKASEKPKEDTASSVLDAAASGAANTLGL